MKKCKWCDSNIEDNIEECPFCKAKQGMHVPTTSNTNNYVEKYLNKNENSNWKYKKRKITIICPTCKSTNTEPISTKERVISVAMLGLFSKKINKSFKCKNCGYTW